MEKTIITTDICGQQYPLHQVSKVYDKCYTIEGSVKDTSIQKFTSFYAGFTLFTMLNDKRMKDRKFVSVKLNDTLDFVVYLNLSQARREIGKLTKVGTYQNEMEQAILRAELMYELCLENGLLSPTATLNDTVYNELWDYVHGNVKA